MRRKRAKELLKKHQHKIDVLWEIRNVDFYGNIKMGSEKRSVTPEEVLESLCAVEIIIAEIQKIIDEDEI